MSEKLDSSDLLELLENNIFELIERGEEAQKIYNLVTKKICKLEGITGASIFISQNADNTGVDCVSHSGNAPQILSDEFSQKIFLETFNFSKARIHKDSSAYIAEIMELGKPKGCLYISVNEDFELDNLICIRRIAFYLTSINERQRLTNRVQHFLDRLEVLNELNQLVVGDIDLQSITKRLTRETSFRFSADLALIYLLEENGKNLEIKGGFGCSAHLIPKTIDSSTGILGQVIKFGGNLSTPDITQYPSHGLDFIEDLNIKGLEVCCLEIHGEVLGVLVLGFEQRENIAEHDLVRFEEFSQGAAVAISIAKSHQRLKRYTDKLEELVEARTSELAYQTHRAEEANEAKSRFLANMSHELRTPLTAIVGYSSVIADGIFGELNEQQKNGLDAVVTSSDHLKRLIDDVLNLARIESGKEEAACEIVNACELLEHCHKLIMQQAIQKKLRLNVFEASEKIRELNLNVDPKHVRQIVINLLSNAVKYTPEDGEITLYCEKQNQHLKICVKDSGVGISKEQQNKLFNRFERGDNEYSLEQEGTGIGLNLTKRLVELNAGKIGIESEIGKGSIFWVLLPLEIEQSVKIENIRECKNLERLDGLTTLIVDTNVDSSQLLQHLFTAAGASSNIADNVQSAKDIIKNNRPDIVLTDIAMQGESGLDLIKYLKSNTKDKLTNIPILVVSAFAFEQDQEKALNAGASGFIAKPYIPKDVVKKVREITLQNAMKG